jgi:hypothetical protein
MGSEPPSWIIIDQKTELNGVFAATWTTKRSRPRLFFANGIEGTILQNVRQFFYPNDIKTTPRSHVFRARLSLLIQLS